MAKVKSTALDLEFMDGAIVSLPNNRKLGKTLKEFKDETLGKIGSENRTRYESELKMELIQELIRETRKKRHLSQQQLGDMVGVNKAQISKLEKGYENATVATITKVFKALNAKVKISIELEDEAQSLELA